MNLELPLFDGDQRKELGIERVYSSNHSWLDKAESLVESISKARDTFTCDTVRFWAEGAGHIGKPLNPNAWGALFNRMSRKGLIVKTGEYTKSEIPSCHSRVIPVWRRA